MEEFKLNIFKKNYGFDFPQFNHLSESESMLLRKRLCKKYGSTDSSLVEDICLIQKCLPGINAEEDFKLIKTLQYLKIQFLNDVFINWYRFDDIDKIALNEFDKYFYNIWYPAADDIDIFDDSLIWIVSIRHDGYVSYYLSE